MNMPNEERTEVSTAQSAFLGDERAVVKTLSGGLTNATYSVETLDGDCFILQKIAPVFSSDGWHDIKTVTEHLTAKGWEVQQLLKSRFGTYYHTDANGQRWRMFTFVPADPSDTYTLDTTTCRTIGQLLAQLHRTLAEVHYTPKAVIPHFHDTKYFFLKLQRYVARMPSSRATDLANSIITAYEDIPHLPVCQHQLIHGDPRSNNILFKKGVPFTYIDFDTIMLGPTWIDIGDLLRSLNGNETQTQAEFSIEKTNSIIEGYYDASQMEYDRHEFRKYSIIAMQHICLELAMRFMIDIVDDSYFGWDETQYPNRAAHNLARAQAQWDIYTLR